MFLIYENENYTENVSSNNNERKLQDNSKNRSLKKNYFFDFLDTNLDNEGDHLKSVQRTFLKLNSEKFKKQSLRNLSNVEV